MELVARRRLQLDSNSRRLRTLPVAIGRQTERIDVFFKRSTTGDPTVVWGDDAVFRFAIRVQLGGTEYALRGSKVGGIRELRPGVEKPRSFASYTLPWGFFGERRGDPKRLGESKADDFQAFIDIEWVSGTIVTEVEASTTEAPAPSRAFRNSVAYDNAASGFSDDDADGQLTVAISVGSNSDRAVLIKSSQLDQFNGPPTEVTATFAGNTPTEEWKDFDHIGVTSHAGWSLAGDSDIPTGSQNAVVSWTTGGQQQLQVGVISMDGVDGTTPTGGLVKSTGTGTSPSVTVTGVGNDDLVIDSLVHDFSGGASVGANQTQRWIQADAYAQAHVSSTQAGSDGGVMSWTLSGSSERDGFSLVALAFKPVAAPPAEGAGSASLAFAATAVGASEFRADGAAALVFAAPGVGSSEFRADGSAALVFSASATGSSTFEAAGSAALVFAGTATGAPTHSADGSAALVFGATATGSSTHEADGAATLAFGATGLAGSIGNSALVFSASGVGDSALEGSGVGAAALTFSATATGASQHAADGSAAMVFADAGVGASQHAAAGAASLVFSATAVSAGTGEGVGSATLAFSATGVGASEFRGAGAAASVFSGAGIGQAQAQGAGAAALVFSASGVGAPTHSGVGSAALTFSVSGISSGATLSAGSAAMTFVADGRTLESSTLRVLVVETEDRTFVVETEDRTFVVPQ